MPVGLGASRDHKASPHPMVDQKAPSSINRSSMCQMPLNLCRSFVAGAPSETEDDGSTSQTDSPEKAVHGRVTISHNLPPTCHDFTLVKSTSQPVDCAQGNADDALWKSRWRVPRPQVCEAKGHRTFSTQRRTAEARQACWL